MHQRQIYWKKLISNSLEIIKKESLTEQNVVLIKNELMRLSGNSENTAKINALIDLFVVARNSDIVLGKPESFVAAGKLESVNDQVINARIRRYKAHFASLRLNLDMDANYNVVVDQAKREVQIVSIESVDDEKLLKTYFKTRDLVPEGNYIIVTDGDHYYSVNYNKLILVKEKETV